jgi:tRNA (guanine26-N2/guanine27-N2)-dimethyltransferase
LRAFAKLEGKKSFTACEPFGGAGIRTCRYVGETPISKIYYNDVNSTAFQIAQMNVEQLIEEEQNRIHMQNKEFSDFLNFLYLKGLVFDFIDIDPYGTPIPYAYHIIKFIKKAGLLAFTATDLASLTGLYPRALYAKYGIGLIDTRIGNVHELAARALITGLQRVGLMQNQSLIPILTLYHRHFIRTFMIRNRGVDKALETTGFLCKCRTCNSLFQANLTKKNPSCYKCGNAHPFRIGPIYIGTLHKDNYLDQLRNDTHINSFNKTKSRSKIITLMDEENKLKIPWSYDIQKVAKYVGKPIPPMDYIIQKLHERGYKCYKTHFSGSCLKTDAPFNDICDTI